MRHVVQPGPIAPERIVAVGTTAKKLTLRLAKGARLLDALSEQFAEHGFCSGTVQLSDGKIGPFGYVMPALATTTAHAAFYSRTFRPAGITSLTTGALTFGSRDGKPFFHCHALWKESDGTLHGGHILPEEAFVAQAFAVKALGFEGAFFASEDDPETGFKLFGPLPGITEPNPSTHRFFALRLRPNQDLATALEGFCRAQNIQRATIHGGVGSIIGAQFDDGRYLEPFATEIALRRGEIVPGQDGKARAILDIALVNYAGGIATGVLARGQNPVLMTMELVLEATG